MPKIDESRPFIPVRIAILTMSDTRTLAEDKSGNTLAELVAEAGHEVAGRALVKDDIAQIRAKVQGWIADPHVDVVITRAAPGLPAATSRPKPSSPCSRKRLTAFRSSST